MFVWVSLGDTRGSALAGPGPLWCFSTIGSTVRMISILRNSTRKGALDALKGLSRQERKRFTEELIRSRIPGISEREIQVLMSRKILPIKGLSKRFTNDEISRGIKKQLWEAVDASIGSSSYASSKLSEASQTTKVGDLLFGVANAYETM